MIIPNFPVPETNEFYPSTIARWMARTAGSPGRLLRQIGLWSSKPNAVAPHNSFELCQQMPKGHPWSSQPKTLLDQNTLLPLYLYFASPEKREELLTRCSTSTHRTNATLGLSSQASSNLRVPLNARHCATCVANDIERLGYSVTYRQHQPSFVKICATHQETLRLNCINCLPAKPCQYWRMAGVCDCAEPVTPPLLEDPATPDFNNWLWLSEQVLHVTSSQVVSSRNHQEILNSALRKQGFEWPNGHMNRQKIDSTLIDIHGTSILTQLGVLSQSTDNFSGNKLLLKSSTRANTSNHVPSIAQMLLIAKLAVPTLSDLDFIPAEANPKERPRPTYISRPRSTPFTREQIIATLKKTNFKFRPTAELLSISVSKLQGELRHFLIPIPLDNNFLKKHGQTIIDEALELLRSGQDRRSIGVKLTLDVKVLERIEIANPDIKANHHLARFALAQSTYRERYSELVTLHPGASVSELRKISKPCVDWIERYDRAWFLEQPRAPRKSYTPVPNYEKMEARDGAASELIEKTALDELSKTSRPIRLSKSKLLASANIFSETASTLARFPKAFVITRKYAETKEIFYRRLLKWALLQESLTGNYISQYRLSYICHIQPFYIKKLKPFILEVADELGIRIAPYSILHPLAQPRLDD